MSAGWLRVGQVPPSPTAAAAPLRADGKWIPQKKNSWPLSSVLYFNVQQHNGIDGSTSYFVGDLTYGVHILMGSCERSRVGVWNMLAAGDSWRWEEQDPLGDEGMHGQRRPRLCCPGRSRPLARGSQRLRGRHCDTRPHVPRQRGWICMAPCGVRSESRRKTSI